MKKFMMVVELLGMGVTHMVKVEAENIGQAERAILAKANREAVGYEVKVTAGFDPDDAFGAEIMKHMMESMSAPISFGDLYYVFKIRNKQYIQNNLAKIEALNEQLEKLKAETFNAMLANH